MNIGVLCVTFNRLPLLRRLLANYAAQEENIHTILVVDNRSTDGTAEFLADWAADPTAKARRHVLGLPTNSGGAGGFHAGFQWYAQHQGDPLDYVYIADDDAFPAEDLFARFDSMRDRFPTDSVAICSSVVAQDGIDVNHRRNVVSKGLRLREIPVPMTEYGKPFQINTYSFVGVFLKSEIIRKGIHPDPTFFIGYDDSDQSLRTSKLGSIWCFPELEVRHDHILDANSSRGIVDWKRYYLIRNRLLLCRRNFGLAPFLAEVLRGHRDNFRMFVPWLKGQRELKHLIKVQYAAIADATWNRKGLHPIYKPGWKV